MLIAFEGPDRAGNMISATNIGHLVGDMPYNMTKQSHSEMADLMSREKGLVSAFSRIDWLTHMAYRLALPKYEWDDSYNPAVFTAPDTHLVFKLPPDNSAHQTLINTYAHLAHMFLRLNKVQDYTLFKTVTIMGVIGQRQHIKYFDSPVYPWGSVGERLVTDDQSLVEFLQHEEQNR